MARYKLPSQLYFRSWQIGTKDRNTGILNPIISEFKKFLNVFIDNA